LSSSALRACVFWLTRSLVRFKRKTGAEFRPAMMDAMDEKLFRLRNSFQSAPPISGPSQDTQGTHHGSLREILDQPRSSLHLPLTQDQARDPSSNYIRHLDDQSHIRRHFRLVIIPPGLVEAFINLDSLEMIELHDGELTCKLDRLNIGDFESAAGCNTRYKRSRRGEQTSGYNPSLSIAFALSLHVSHYPFLWKV
jgi:hypothetical protein